MAGGNSPAWVDPAADIAASPATVEGAGHMIVSGR